MERIRWTDERLDERMTAIDDRSELLLDQMRAMCGELGSFRSEVKGEIAGLRSEVKDEIAGLRSEVKGEIAGLRSEVKGEIAQLRGEVSDLRTAMLAFNRQVTHIVAAFAVGLLGILAALAAAGITAAL